jgi:peptidyl-prolyl cis-trans isomerase A (cyclophilin A)
MGKITKATKSVLPALVTVALVAAVAQAQPQSKSGGASHASQGTTAKKTPGTTAARSYDRALLKPALLKEKAPEEYKVLFSTTRGDFTVSVHRAWAPLGADRFYNLVKHHFYDNASFFRVLPRFVVQFGISAYPAVNAAWHNANIKDDPVKESNHRGYITFATGGPNTRTTQVFISLGDNKRLDSMGFSPFGVVEGQGMNVVEMMYEGYGEGAPQGAGPDQEKIQTQGKPYLDKGWPKLDYIKSARLLTAAPGTTPKPTSRPAPGMKKQQ